MLEAIDRVRELGYLTPVERVALVTFTLFVLKQSIAVDGEGASQIRPVSAALAGALMGLEAAKAAEKEAESAETIARNAENRKLSAFTRLQKAKERKMAAEAKTLELEQEHDDLKRYSDRRLANLLAENNVIAAQTSARAVAKQALAAAKKAALASARAHRKAAKQLAGESAEQLRARMSNIARLKSFRGARWFNNGIRSRRVREGDVVPEGFVPGRLERGWKHTPEAIAKMKATRAMREPPTPSGSKWYTNGTIDVVQSPEEPAPEGFRPGRSTGVTGMKLPWYTDGVTNRRIKPGDPIPEGFRPGLMMNRKRKTKQPE